MASDISEAVRRFVAERAEYRCEYCLLHESDANSAHQIDHIISRKRRSFRLRQSCLCLCEMQRLEGNWHWLDQYCDWRFRQLFHQRRQRWVDHFELWVVLIEPLTPEGLVTTRLLKLNLDKRVVEHNLLAAVGRYPR